MCDESVTPPNHANTTQIASSNPIEYSNTQNPLHIHLQYTNNHNFWSNHC